MRVLKTIIRFLVRLTGWTFSLVCAVIFLFLAGYWLGWKTVPERRTLAELVPSATNIHAAARAVAATTNTSANLAAQGETAQERMVRLARILVSSADERDSNIKISVEIASLTLDEVYASLAALQSAPSTASFNQLRTLLLTRMAALSPYAAFDYARREFNSGNASGGAFMTQVLQRWSYSDPVAALKAWHDFTSSGVAMDESTLMRNNQYGLDNILRQLGSKNLNLALSEVAKLPPGLEETAWFSLSPLAMKEQSRNQLFAAIAALPEGDTRARAMSEAVEMWVRTPGQKDAALQWLDATKFTRAEQNRIDQRIADWVGEDRRSSTEWLVSRAQSPAERSERMENSISSWANEDPVASGEWLKAQGINDDTARAIAMYARTVVNQHPELGVEWARQIPDENLKQRTFRQIESRLRLLYPHRADALLSAGK